MTYAEAFETLEKARAEYAAHAAESRACGFEVEPFEDWIGATSARARAEARWHAAAAADELDLY